MMPEALWRYTCEGCKEHLDPDEVDEFGHVCDGWWDEHGVFDVVPKIFVERVPQPTDSEPTAP